MITSDQHDPVKPSQTRPLFATSPDVAFFMPKI
jgi:hypothetical protein